MKSQQKKHLSEMNGIASLDPWPYIYTIYTKYNCIYCFLWFSEVEFCFTLMQVVILKRKSDLTTLYNLLIIQDFSRGQPVKVPSMGFVME